MTGSQINSRLLRSVGYLVAVGLIVLAGLAQAYWTGQWSAANNKAISIAVERLKGLPSEVGDWKGVSQDIAAYQLEEGEIAGYRAWDFQNTEDGQRLTVFIVCGRPSPISLHTPDWCYGGAGYRVQGSIEPLQLQFSDTGHGPSATFNTAYFRKPNELVPSGLRILWSWNADGQWQVPARPRFQFASREVLYKLYVVERVAENPESEDGQSLLVTPKAFLQLFLPMLDRELFTSQEVQTVTTVPSLAPITGDERR